MKMNQRYGHICYNHTTGNINVPKLFQKNLHKHCSYRHKMNATEQEHWSHSVSLASLSL